MSVPDPPAPLPRPMLGRLGDRPDRDAADPDLLVRDLAVLRDSGYLKLAVPAALGGAAFGLRQVACVQRQLAARAPAAALAVTAHHAWIGAAAGVLASGDPNDAAARWILREAARGRFFAGHPGPFRPAGQPRRAEPVVRRRRGRSGLDELEALAADPPCWDWLAVHAPDGGKGGRLGMVHTFARRGGLGGGSSASEPLVAGVFGWALPLTGMAWYAIARQAFELAVRRAGSQPAGDPWAAGGLRAGQAGSAAAGHPLDRWEVAEAALRLDSLRGQLDEAIDGWQRRTAAGGALTSLDPGGQWLIRLFTVRHAAADGARRVIELAAEIAGEKTGLADLTGPAGPVGPVRA
jgi:alkylation response protein AidB-like acyl-CoA dehydrogenase